MRDGHGKDANDRAKMEQKKRQGWRSGTLGAHTPDHLRVEFDGLALAILAKRHVDDAWAPLVQTRSRAARKAALALSKRRWRPSAQSAMRYMRG